MRKDSSETDIFSFYTETPEGRYYLAGFIRFASTNLAQTHLCFQLSRAPWERDAIVGRIANYEVVVPTQSTECLLEHIFDWAAEKMYTPLDMLTILV